MAKDRQLIPAVGPFLTDLRDAGLRLGDAAANELLAIAGER